MRLTDVCREWSGDRAGAVIEVRDKGGRRWGQSPSKLLNKWDFFFFVAILLGL